MHDHFNAMHEMFQDSTVDASLSVPEIIKDFATIEKGSDPLAWLGLASYLVGGVAGVVSPIKGIGAKGQEGAGWISSITYLVGSIANVANANKPDAPHEITGDDLTSQLQKMFSVYREVLVDSLRLGAGQHGNYSQLPAQDTISDGQYFFFGEGPGGASANHQCNPCSQSGRRILRKRSLVSAWSSHELRTSQNTALAKQLLGFSEATHSPNTRKGRSTPSRPNSLTKA